MDNPWKLATLGLALTGVTALSTGLTTAYVMRVPEGASADSRAFAASAPVATSAPAVRLIPAAASAPMAPPPVVATQAAVVRPAAVRRVAVAPVAVEPVAYDCATGGQRAMKIAKPGLIGTLAGAGLGAIGGAIANGGSGAGKGALIGGIAGAVAGGGYGAYKTKQECGTIFGSASLPGF